MLRSSLDDIARARHTDCCLDSRAGRDGVCHLRPRQPAADARLHRALRHQRHLQLHERVSQQLRLVCRPAGRAARRVLVRAHAVSARQRQGVRRAERRSRSRLSVRALRPGAGLRALSRLRGLLRSENRLCALRADLSQHRGDFRGVRHDHQVLADDSARAARARPQSSRGHAGRAHRRRAVRGRRRLRAGVLPAGIRRRRDAGRERGPAAAVSRRSPRTSRSSSRSI